MLVIETVSKALKIQSGQRGWFARRTGAAKFGTERCAEFDCLSLRQQDCLYVRRGNRRTAMAPSARATAKQHKFTFFLDELVEHRLRPLEARSLFALLGLTSSFP